MESSTTNNTALGVTDTLTQMIGVLGFHDVTSFIMTCIFVLAGVAFVMAGIVALIRKQRARRAELDKIDVELNKSAVAEKLIAEQPVVKHETPTVVPTPQPSVVPVAPKPVVASETPKTMVPAAPAPTPSVAKPVAVEAPRTVMPVAPKPVVVVETPKAIVPAAPKPVVAVEAPKPVAAPAPKPIVPAAAKPAVMETPAPVAPVVVAEQAPPVVPAVSHDDGKLALGAALKSTRGGFMNKLARLFARGSEVSDADFEEMEAILFTADIGAKTAQKLLDVMRERALHEKGASKEFLRTVLKEEMTKILESAQQQTSTDAASPQVVMFVGVNGAGKTTSIGKLGAQLAQSGKKVLFGAGDTFRAAAVEQLSVWGERVGAQIIAGKENSDSAAVLFEAIEKAKNSDVDYVLCDTAGRLHTKTSLMDELKKVHRVVSKAQTGAPHQVYLVIDATMGQNAISQAREFAAATPLTGVILSKLDGTAKGGVALGIVDELKVPIRYVGTGEQINDLRDFDAKAFVDALFQEA